MLVLDRSKLSKVLYFSTCMCRRVEHLQYKMYAKQTKLKAQDIAVAHGQSPVVLALSNNDLHLLDLSSGDHIRTFTLSTTSSISRIFVCGSAIFANDDFGTIRCVTKPQLSENVQRGVLHSA
jgi:hypothetical protein